MNLASLWPRINDRIHLTMSRRLMRRRAKMRNEVPLISFTFDDFPRSALHTGGAILKGQDLRATYYASLGLMGREAPVGTIFSADDLQLVVSEGHELGSHTFSHCHAWQTRPSEFEKSIIDNQSALSRFLPEARFATLSYPISQPRPLTKRRAARHFACCRGGGQTFNAGIIDLNYLRAFFLEKSKDITSVSEMIDRNIEARGWLIFATHDVSEQPTRFGCTPNFFEDVVRLALRSGARILPVREACEVATRNGPPSHSTNDSNGILRTSGSPPLAASAGDSA